VRWAMASKRAAADFVLVRFPEDEDEDEDEAHPKATAIEARATRRPHGTRMR